jgi:hypothetical protein
MGWRGTAVLAVVALVLGVYLWIEKPPREDVPRSGDILAAAPRQPTEPVRPLFAFTPAQVTGIRLERGGRVVEAESHDGSWRKTEPPGAVDDFLRNLTQLAIVSEIPAALGDLKDYGLQPARTRLELRLRDQRPLVLQIGDRNPAATGVYVRVGDGSVLLAGALVEWEFEKAFKALSAPEGG